MDAADLLIVFIHGFKGTDATFQDFPQRIEHALNEALSETRVRSLVYPRYDTRGELAQAVENFTEWLANTVVHEESRFREAGEADKKIRVVLAGHSMGGLVAVDATLALLSSTNGGKTGDGPIQKQRPATEQTKPLWPEIIGVIAYDTPYYGLNPRVFSNSASQLSDIAKKVSGAMSFIAAARSALAPSAGASAGAGAASVQKRIAGPKENDEDAPSSKGSSAWLWAAGAGAGALATAGAAGAAYLYRDPLSKSATESVTWATSHLAYVSNLWDDNGLVQRVERLIKEPRIFFHCFYTALRPLQTSAKEARTFCVLPPDPVKHHFSPTYNSKAFHEIQFHMHMFEAEANSGYHAMSKATLDRLVLCLENDRKYGNQAATQEASEKADQAYEESEDARSAGQVIDLDEKPEATKKQPAGPANRDEGTKQNPIDLEEMLRLRGGAPTLEISDERRGGKRDIFTSRPTLPDLLCIIFDTNPLVWFADRETSENISEDLKDISEKTTSDGTGIQSAYPGEARGTGAKSRLEIEDTLRCLLIFINAYLSIQEDNALAVFASHLGDTSLLYSSVDQARDENRDDDVERSAFGYGPFQQADDAVVESFKELVDRQSPQEALAANATSSMACALSMTLCYINRLTKSGLEANFNPRILVISVSADAASQYIGMMNAIFAAQKATVPIDVFRLIGPDTESVFLQQAAYITNGTYISLPKDESLLQYLMACFLPSGTIRNQFILPSQENVDFRAACFCHKRIIDMGFVCSVCLSIYCSPIFVCTTCKTKFPLSTVTRYRTQKPAKTSMASSTGKPGQGTNTSTNGRNGKGPVRGDVVHLD